jgi:hypothetical protein
MAGENNSVEFELDRCPRCHSDVWSDGHQIYPFSCNQKLDCNQELDVDSILDEAIQEWLSHCNIALMDHFENSLKEIIGKKFSGAIEKNKKNMCGAGQL